MKKFLLMSLVVAVAFFMQYCSSSRSAAKAHKNITYMANIQPVVQTNCAPCHFPPKGNKRPYDNYANLKQDIDTILVRIQKNPDERGFMPARHPKLADSTINLFAQWKKDGLLEK